MKNYSTLIQAIEHRPYPIPKGHWRYYQAWNNAVFLHWKISTAILRPMIPSQLEIDTVDGNAYVSIVIFRMLDIRPRYLPAVNVVSDFEEINVRTYVIKDGKPGVYFLSIEANKKLAAWVAKKLSDLPYEYAHIYRSKDGIQSQHPKRSYRLNVRYEIGVVIASPTPIDLWLTERYCLYVDHKEHLYRYDIHHLPWSVHTLHIQSLDVDYNIQALHIHNNPDIVHFSPGVAVLAWSRVIV